MSRDYKTRKSSSKSTNENGGSAFMGGFVGYALGLASAIGIWLYLNYAPSPFLPTEKAASSSNQTQPTDETRKSLNKPVHEEPEIMVEEKPRFDFYKILPGIDEPEMDHEYRKSAEQSTQPHLTAQTTEVNSKSMEISSQPSLPGSGITTAPSSPQHTAAIPLRTLPVEPKQPIPQSQQSVSPQIKNPSTVKEKIFLQAGAFRKNDEAENLKARLALLGVFASIQPIDLVEKGVWYRVRIGPFTNKSDSDQTSNSLKENGIDTQFIRVQ
ncbi:SPOR domain-containing protein [Nitrosomonas supralitoralis]|uniref:SPOR domain-containing protein n=1 Tax=Nitrosomonas supralitoralis TaxID=2116706 RepID=A0A2P7NYF4_9PROT|nr:SPOR domain-containing protein [Nitrosomonas supralitoralis]PSJ18513.1 SPOR domain-containing protein [Nitrosomonas supralitoralis]